MADLTSAGTGAGGLGTPEARWSFIFLLCCGVAGIALGGQWAQAPLLWTLAGLAALAASLLLTTPVRHPLPPSRAVWIPPLALLVAAVALHQTEPHNDFAVLSFASYLVTFLIVRGNVLAGGLGSALVIGYALAWVLPQQPDLRMLGEVLGVPLGGVAAAVAWRLVLRAIVRQERAHRGEAAMAADRARWSALAVRRSEAELTTIRTVVVPLLNRVAAGEPIDATLRAELARTEASVRDRIRVPQLQHPQLVATIEALRLRGVGVLVLGEPQLGEPIGEALALRLHAELEPLQTGRVTVRALPDDRPAAISVLIQDEAGSRRLQFSASGVLLSKGETVLIR